MSNHEIIELIETTQTMDVNEIFNEILTELDRAESKFPEWPRDIVHAVAILSKCIGECNMDALNLYNHKETDISIIKQRLIETGAMVVRCLRNFPSDE